MPTGFDVVTGRQTAVPDDALTINAAGVEIRSGLAYLVGPAFFDPQLNGFAGIDFQDPQITREDLEAAMRAMRSTGCAHCLVTLITNSAEFLSAQLARLGGFLDGSALLREAILGFHLEGPFLAPKDGYIGAHAAEHTRAADSALLDEWHRASGDRVRMITIGPEVAGAVDLTRHATEAGVMVCAGHTDASIDQLHAAVAAGLRLFTHLGNGCARSVDRHDSIVQRVLAIPELMASLIPDGIHLPPFVLANLARGLGRARLVATTDASSPAGAPQGTYRLGQLELELGADRVVHNPGGHGFAGSSLTMVEGFYNLVRLGGLGVADAWHAWTRLRTLMFPTTTAPALALPFPGGFPLPSAHAGAAGAGGPG